MKYRLVFWYETEQEEFNDILELLEYLNNVYQWDENDIFEDDDFSLLKIKKGLENNGYFEFCDGDYVEYANKPFKQKCEHDLTFER